MSLGNYRHPGPRHKEPEVRAAGSGPFPVDPLDLADLLENSEQLVLIDCTMVLVHLLGK